jgi:hypothetical protein
MPQPGQNSVQLRRAVASSYLGSLIEYYDFLLYATASAVVFNKVFFTNLDPVVATVASFGTFATGYLARPIGGVICGHFGDLLGRKRMLVLTMTLMGVASFLIGLLPGYAQIGGWAPVGLVLLRVIQGISVGGEWGGAVLMSAEHATSRRGLWGELHQCRRAVRSGRLHRRAQRNRRDRRRGCLPGLGLADSVPAQPGPAGRRPVRPVPGGGDAGVSGRPARRPASVHPVCRRAARSPEDPVARHRGGTVRVRRAVHDHHVCAVLRGAGGPFAADRTQRADHLLGLRHRRDHRLVRRLRPVRPAPNRAGRRGGHGGLRFCPVPTGGQRHRRCSPWRWCSASPSCTR